MNTDTNPANPTHCGACRAPVTNDEHAVMVRREPDGSLSRFALCQPCLEAGCQFGGRCG